MPSANDPVLRNIPSVELLLQAAQSQPWAANVPRKLLTDAVRSSVDALRKELLSAPAADVTPENLREDVLQRIRLQLQSSAQPFYRKAVNATGIILHTGLGRAVLPSQAMRQVQDQLSGYSLLQVDVESGKRSRRDERIEWLLQRLTGCESATVVNNNAAATLLVLNTVGRGREVIVSRGQLVEIGGSFRLPEVLAASGALMVEVGTTNKTHPRDYENAITPDTAAILRVHPSNYKITGFTAEVPLEELVKIAHARKVVLIDDVGAGALLDFSRFGFQKEPTLPESLAAGADLTTSSTDKLIGGPQGGIILGRKTLVEAVRKNPLSRALRVGKFTLAALEATLSLFLDESRALAEIPTLRMLSRSLDDLSSQARRIADELSRQAPSLSVDVIDGFSQMGSGSLPEQNLPTRLVALASKTLTPDDLAARLRAASPPVFARIQDDRVLLDPRTLLEGDEPLLIQVVASAAAH